MGTVLLSRDVFRESVFVRDERCCVACSKPAKDAHHILERRLFPDGGYYLDNGASLCAEHHLAAEATTLGCEEIRRLCKIANVVLPPHLYADQEYDKWGNPILANGLRLRGELFDDESARRALASVLHLFTNRVKYPRTYHLPWSPGMTDDDRQMEDVSIFEGRDVVVTVKMDGECTTMGRDYLHARSLDYQPHPSRNFVKILHAQIGFELPEGWRVCGENLYAKHAIHYKHLKNFFQVFSFWNERNVCLSWEETETWTKLLGLVTVPVLYRGLWDEQKIRNLWQPVYFGDEMEGYVVRLVDEFHYRDFRRSVGKYVRVNHVPVHGGHWMNRIVVPNELVRR